MKLARPRVLLAAIPIALLVGGVTYAAAPVDRPGQAAPLAAAHVHPAATGPTGATVPAPAAEPATAAVAPATIAAAPGTFL